MNIRSDVARLTDIVGIAQKTADKLALEGVTTVQHIRDMAEEELDRLDAKLGLRGSPRLMKWRIQAETLLANQVEEAPTVSDGVSSPTEAVSDKDEVIAKLSAKLAELSAAVKSGEAAVKLDLRRRLNRHRDYGEVYGQHLDDSEKSTGAAFSQLRDGEEVFFNYQGLEIKLGETPDQVTDVDAEPEYIARDFADFHPLNYLDEKATYDFDFVRRAVQSRFGRNVKTERHAKAMLHEQLRQNH